MHMSRHEAITETSAEHCIHRTGQAHLARMMMKARAVMMMQMTCLCYPLLHTVPLFLLIVS